MAPALDALLRARRGPLVDVGANTGHTLKKLFSVQPDRAYWGFEPQPEAVARLLEFATAKSLRECEILPVALSDKAGFLRLHRNRGTDPTASLIPDFRPNDYHRDGIFVPTVRGDTALEQLGVREVSVLKIDVEGAELEVLRGLSDTCRRERPSILLEVLPNFLFTTGAQLPPDIVTYRDGRLRELDALLGDLEYERYRIRAGKPGAGVLRHVAGLDAKESSRQDYNVLALPVEDREQRLAQLVEVGFDVG
jgi:FkbM family methyltransferase